MDNRGGPAFRSNRRWNGSQMVFHSGGSHRRHTPENPRNRGDGQNYRGRGMVAAGLDPAKAQVWPNVNARSFVPYMSQAVGRYTRGRGRVYPGMAAEFPHPRPQWNYSNYHSNMASEFRGSTGPTRIARGPGRIFRRRGSYTQSFDTQQGGKVPTYIGINPDGEVCADHKPQSSAEVVNEGTAGIAPESVTSDLHNVNTVPVALALVPLNTCVVPDVEKHIQHSQFEENATGKKQGEVAKMTSGTGADANECKFDWYISDEDDTRPVAQVVQMGGDVEKEDDSAAENMLTKQVAGLNINEGRRAKPIMPIITPVGTICFHLQEDIVLDMTVNSSWRIRALDSDIEVAISACRTVSFFTHPLGQVSQKGTVLNFISNDGNRKMFGRITHRGVGFTSSNAVCAYMIDASGVHGIKHFVSSIADDCDLEVLHLKITPGKDTLEKAKLLLQNIDMYRNRKSSMIWHCGDLRICHQAEGTVDVQTKNGFCRVRVNPNGAFYLRTQFLEVFGCLGKDAHLIIKRGEKRICIRDGRFSAFVGGCGAALNARNQIVLL